MTGIGDSFIIYQELVCGRKYTMELVDENGRRLYERSFVPAKEIIILFG